MLPSTQRRCKGGLGYLCGTNPRSLWCILESYYHVDTHVGMYTIETDWEDWPPKWKRPTILSWKEIYVGAEQNDIEKGTEKSVAEIKIVSDTRLMPYDVNQEIEYFKTTFFKLTWTL